MLSDLQADHRLLVTMEENVKIGGFGEQVREYIDENGIDLEVINIALPDDYVEHGNVELLKKETGIDADSIVAKLRYYPGIRHEKQA